MTNEEDLDFAALVRKRPAVYFGDDGANSLIQMLVLEAEIGSAGTLAVLLRGDGSILLDFGDEPAAAEYWQALEDAPNSPSPGFIGAGLGLWHVCPACARSDIARSRDSAWTSPPTTTSAL